MSAIADFAAKQKAFNDRQGAAVDAAVTSITAIQGDLKTLNDKITELQNSPGAITPEDQALLDQLDAQGEAVSTKVEAAAAALSNLDAMTPPAPPFDFGVFARYRAQVTSASEGAVLRP